VDRTLGARRCPGGDRRLGGLILADVTLYYVHHEGEEYFNCDLFISAQDTEEAFELWREYSRQNLWPVDNCKKVRIWEVPSAEDISMTIDWSDLVSFDFCL